MFDFKHMHEAVDFYIKNGFRPMPQHGVDEGCNHRSTVLDDDCEGQCYGKVPMQRSWADKDEFTKEDFPKGCNLGLIMGKQRDGRWFVGFDVDGELDLSKYLHLPETLECKTNRGRHLIFEVTPDAPLGNWNDVFSTRINNENSEYKFGYKGALDIRYCRGAMTSPPSKTITGDEYEWVKWRQPAFLPDSEVRYLIKKRKFYYPHIKRYAKWSSDPAHKGKRP